MRTGGGEKWEKEAGREVERNRVKREKREETKGQEKKREKEKDRGGRKG